MFGRVLTAAVVALALVSSATAAWPAAAATNTAVRSHKLIVAVKKNLAPAAEKKLAVLVLISQNGGAPAGAVATPSNSADHKLEVIPSCRLEGSGFVCSKLRIVEVY
jgi:hypothetical protein